MKLKKTTFILMVALVIILMGMIMVTQYFTNKSTYALGTGNTQAIETFKINNGIQQLVNLSFDLESKFIRPGADNLSANRKASLTDSLTMLGYNSTILTEAVARLNNNKNVKNLDKQVSDLLSISLEILSTDNAKRKNILIDSLRKRQIGNTVYFICLDVQKSLENNLQQTLVTNSKEANVLSLYNKILGIFAIVAILIMTTIIIRRQVQQLQLISDLKDAEEAALKSKNAKDDFLANMSHELRTPLNALIGFGNLLSQTNLTEKQKEYMNIIQSSGYNLLNVVNDILDLSKIEAGKLKIINVPFSLTELMQDLEKMFSTAIKEKNLSYTWSSDDKIPAVLKGDPGRLKQVLINLINNGIKFTSQGGIKINIGIIWTDDTTNKLKLAFSVKDTGAGIPAEKIQTIFERFEQLEYGTTRQHGGTGLGLTIVKNIVEKLAGAISVYSEVNKGSEFNFTCIFEKIETLSAASVAKNIISNKLTFEKASLLLVEDNFANQTLIKHILHKYKADIAFADNGYMALKMIENNSYDLILMDIQMPLMDGYSAIKEIRENMQLQVPVIAMTAYVSELEIAKCLRSGFSDYIPKPIEESVLIEKLSKFILNKSYYKKSTAHTDLSYLKELLQGDMVAVNEVLTEVEKQWNLDKNEVATAVLSNNIGDIKRILHRVKSTFSPFGTQHKIYEHIKKGETEIIASDKIDGDKCDVFVKIIDETLSEAKAIVT